MTMVVAAIALFYAQAASGAFKTTTKNAVKVSPHFA